MGSGGMICAIAGDATIEATAATANISFRPTPELQRINT
jgi:hypothetical protein